jgi:hypothetical protein
VGAFHYLSGTGIARGTCHVQVDPPLTSTVQAGGRILSVRNPFPPTAGCAFGVLEHDRASAVTASASRHPPAYASAHGAADACSFFVFGLASAARFGERLLFRALSHAGNGARKGFLVDVRIMQEEVRGRSAFILLKTASDHWTIYAGLRTTV